MVSAASVKEISRGKNQGTKKLLAGLQNKNSFQVFHVTEL
jgi:hypothetical protein